MCRLPAAHAATQRVRAGAGSRTWMYDFRHRAAPSQVAGHCLEIPSAWDLQDAPGVAAALGDAPQEPADVVHGDWPRCVERGRCDWPSAGEQAGGARVYTGTAQFDPDAYRLERELLGDAARS